MSSTLTADHARQSITEHVRAKGEEIHSRYPQLGWAELLQVLDNRELVRYPCELGFEAAGLLPGEFAHAEPKGALPEAGFRMLVHPCFQADLERVPFLVLYHLVTVNYGDFASAEDAEVFGAAALGLSQEEYYGAVCKLADELEAHPGDVRVGQSSPPGQGGVTCGSIPADSESA